jgi:hypothetical protein
MNTLMLILALNSIENDEFFKIREPEPMPIIVRPNTSYQTIHDQTHGSDGTIQYQMGDMLIEDGNVICHRVGNQIFCY